MTATATLETATTAGVVVTLTGSVLGLQFESLAVGFLGAVIAQTLITDPPDETVTLPRRYLRAFSQLVAAGLLAGMLTPVVEKMMATILPSTVGLSSLHIATAGIIGMVAPAIVPMLRKITQRLGEKP